MPTSIRTKSSGKLYATLSKKALAYKKNASSIFVCRLASVVLAFSIVGYPIVAPLSVLLDVPNRYVSVPFRAFIFALGIYLCVRMLINRERFWISVFGVAWWGFWVLYISRIVLDAWLNPGALRLTFVEYILYAIGMCLVPSVAVWRGWSATEIHKLGHLIWWLAFLGAALNLAMLLQHGAYGSVADLAATRQAAITLGPIGAGHLGTTLSILSAWWYLGASSRSPQITALLILGFSLGLATALASASRGPIVALGCILPIIFVIRSGYGRRPRWLRLAVFLGILVSGLAWVAARLDVVAAFVRLERMMGGDAGLGAVRLDLYAGALRMIQENPVVGSGTEPLGYYPHNVLLESFLVFGLLSGVLFSVLVVVGIRSGARLLARRSEGGWLALLLFQYLLGAMVSGSLYTNAAMWCLLVVVGGQGLLAGMEKARDPSRSYLHVVAAADSEIENSRGGGRGWMVYDSG